MLLFVLPPRHHSVNIMELNRLSKMSGLTFVMNAKQKKGKTFCYINFSSSYDIPFRQNKISSAI